MIKYLLKCLMLLVFLLYSLDLYHPTLDTWTRYVHNWNSWSDQSIQIALLLGSFKVWAAVMGSLSPWTEHIESLGQLGFEMVQTDA